MEAGPSYSQPDQGATRGDSTGARRGRQGPTVDTHMDATPDHEFEPTSAIEPLPAFEQQTTDNQTWPVENSGATSSPTPGHQGAVAPESPLFHSEPHRGTPFWRRMVAIIGLTATSVVGGVIIAIAIAALVMGMAILVQTLIT